MTLQVYQKVALTDVFSDIFIELDEDYDSFFKEFETEMSEKVYIGLKKKQALTPGKLVVRLEHFIKEYKRTDKEDLGIILSSAGNRVIVLWSSAPV